MVDETLDIPGLAGSLRRASCNRALLRAASQLEPRGVAVESCDDLGALPSSMRTLTPSAIPAGASALRRSIDEADALLIVAPEYNDGPSTVLKNALDWASRGPVRVLAGKPVAVMGMSPGRSGARGGIKSVVRTVRRTGSEVPSHTVAVPFAPQVFTDGLELADLHVRAEVAPVVAELADRARAAGEAAA